MVSEASGRAMPASFFLFLLGGGRPPAHIRRAHDRQRNEVNAVGQRPLLARSPAGGAGADGAMPHPGEAPPAQTRKTQ